MKFFVWADKDSAKLSQVKESAEFFGLDAELIGLGAEVDEELMFKVPALCEALSVLEDDEVVCATDGFDVFFQEDEESIHEKFLSFDCDVVCCTERAYSHQYRRYKEHYDNIAGPSRYKYLNLGCIIGYGGALKKIFNAISLIRFKAVRKILGKATYIGNRLIPRTGADEQVPTTYINPFGFNDQALVGKYIAEGPNDVRVQLDYDCKLFWCTAFEWEDIDVHYSILDNKITNIHTNNSPSCIHVPWEKRYRDVFLKLHELSRKTRHAGRGGQEFAR